MMFDGRDSKEDFWAKKMEQATMATLQGPDISTLPIQPIIKKENLYKRTYVLTAKKLVSRRMTAHNVNRPPNPDQS